MSKPVKKVAPEAESGKAAVSLLPDMMRPWVAPIFREESLFDHDTVSVVCERCQKEGKTSRVYHRGGETTLVAFIPYYDEQGKYHHHDSNSVTSEYSCSNGHCWTEERRGSPCPTCGTEWMKERANAKPVAVPPDTAGPDLRAGIAGTGFNGIGVDTPGLQDSNRAVIATDNLPTKNEVPR